MLKYDIKLLLQVKENKKKKTKQIHNHVQPLDFKRGRKGVSSSYSWQNNCEKYTGTRQYTSYIDNVESLKIYVQKLITMKHKNES